MLMLVEAVRRMMFGVTLCRASMVFLVVTAAFLEISVDCDVVLGDRVNDTVVACGGLNDEVDAVDADVLAPVVADLVPAAVFSVAIDPASRCHSR